MPNCGFVCWYMSHCFLHACVTVIHRMTNKETFVKRFSSRVIEFACDERQRYEAHISGSVRSEEKVGVRRRFRGTQRVADLRSFLARGTVYLPERRNKI